MKFLRELSERLQKTGAPDTVESSPGETRLFWDGLTLQLSGKWPGVMLWTVDGRQSYLQFNEHGKIETFSSASPAFSQGWHSSPERLSHGEPETLRGVLAGLAHISKHLPKSEQCIPGLLEKTKALYLYPSRGEDAVRWWNDGKDIKGLTSYVSSNENHAEMEVHDAGGNRSGTSIDRVDGKFKWMTWLAVKGERNTMLSTEIYSAEEHLHLLDHLPESIHDSLKPIYSSAQIRVPLPLPKNMFLGFRKSFHI